MRSASGWKFFGLAAFLVLLPQFSWGASVDHFTFEHGATVSPPHNLPNLWIAGHPVWVTITAYSDAVGTLAADMNDTAKLSCSLDHSGTLKIIRPANPIQFVSGIWSGEITLFRADRYQGENNNILITYRTLSNPSLALHTRAEYPDRMLIIAPGMTAYPGLNPDVWPGFNGADGQPSVQTAGTAITNISFFLCDPYWNKVTYTASANEPITLNCPDPYPAVIQGYGAFIGNTQSVTLTAGVYTAKNALTLFTVNGATGQPIGVHKAGMTDFRLGSGGFNPVPVRYAQAGDGFWLLPPHAEKTAGMPFAVTISGF